MADKTYTDERVIAYTKEKHQGEAHQLQDQEQTAQDVRELVKGQTHESVMKVLTDSPYISYRQANLEGDFYRDYTKVLLMLR